MSLASENVGYRYDARGRLVKVSRSGSANNGITACYAYDKADNRSTVAVSTTDCDPSPSFSIGDASVTEGGNLVLTVTKTGSTSNSYSVSFATANGSATVGSDYAANSGALTFAPADTIKTITVATIGDATAESAETVLVNLSGATGGATISDAQGVGTINDNGVVGPSFSIGDASGAESAGATIVFVVVKSGTTASSLSINYSTANGTATSGADYIAQSGTLTFAPSETTKLITISLWNNNYQETQEYFYINLSAATGGAIITDPQAVGIIELDEETDPALCAPASGGESQVDSEGSASVDCGASES